MYFCSMSSAWNCFTRISVKCLCWQAFHMHHLFNVLGLEVFHTHLSKKFMLVRISHASFNQRRGLGTLSPAPPSNVYACKCFICIFCLKSWVWNCFTRLSVKCLCWQVFHMHLAFEIFGMGTASHASLSNV